MSPRPLPIPRLPAAPLPRRHARLERLRVTLADGARTTLHVASYDRAGYRTRIELLEHPATLVHWCREHDVRHAVVGGFFLRPDYLPLGELRLGGAPVASAPFTAPWSSVRACLAIDAEGPQIVRRDDLGADPDGDLLQAGPLLVRDRRPVYLDGCDDEGFSAGAEQFDSDITDGRYPRAALGIAGRRVVAVACDGRTRRDSGMTLGELARALVDLGMDHALNLDGGGSSSLIHGGRLRNRPREEHGVDLLAGRPIVSAIVFEPR